MKILVIGAHPDDEVLGCGGTIVKHAAEGDEVFTLILTDGTATRYEESMSTEMKKCSEKCSDILGVKKIFWGNFPNQLLDTVPLNDVIKFIEKVVEEIRPDIVYTHDGNDLNRDHKIIYEATLVSTRPLPGSNIKEIRSYPAASSTEYNDYDRGTLFYADIFVDITGSIDKKVEAFLAYSTEQREFPHPRSSEAIINYAVNYGIKCGREFAEGFKLVRKIEV